MNILITGGSGFIGSHLVSELKKRNNVVVLFRDLSSALLGKWLTEALTGCTMVQGDLLNQNILRRILAEYGVSHIYHMAAQAIVASALKDPFGTFQTNILGTVNLLEACRQTDVKQIYVQSTDKAYGERMEAKEEDPLVSTGIYETSKACGDLVAQTYMDTYGLNVIIGRACNTFGYDLAKRIIPNTIRSCLRGEPPIIFEGEETVRQYIYVEDLCNAITTLMKTVDKGIFNIATDDILTQEQVVRKICNYFPLTPKLVKRDKPLKEIQKQSVNWDKLKDSGWKPKHSFEEGIKLTIERFEKYGYYSSK